MCRSILSLCHASSWRLMLSLLRLLCYRWGWNYHRGVSIVMESIQGRGLGSWSFLMSGCRFVSWRMWWLRRKTNMRGIWGRKLSLEERVCGLSVRCWRKNVGWLWGGGGEILRRNWMIKYKRVGSIMILNKRKRELCQFKKMSWYRMFFMTKTLLRGLLVWWNGRCQ